MAVVVLIAGLLVWKLVPGRSDAVAVPVPPAAVAASTPTADGPAPRGWAAAVPRTRPGGTADAVTLDAREVAPARFGHQVQIVRNALRAGEGIRLLRVQADGSVVALAVDSGGLNADGTGARWVASKRDLERQTLPTGPAIDSLRPLGPADIQARVPAKLLRAMERAGGVAPGKLVLQHTTTGILGDEPTWLVKWPGVYVTLFASADGHTIKR